MKKNVLSVALLMMSGFTFAQVGIGTANPNSSALLDIEAQAGSFKGVLIPRIPLIAVNNSSNISGTTPNSLLVFNTTDSNDLKPGYYYWFNSRWVRLISSTDDLLNQMAINEELAVNLADETLFLRDTKNNIVSVPLADINIVTTLTSNGQGKYTYKSEDNTETAIDVTSDVITNISLILNEENVVNEIIQSITAQAKDITGDASIEVIGGIKAVLAPTTLSIRDRSISNAKIKPGQNKQLLVTDANGIVNWVDVTDELIQELVDQNETVTLLVDGGDGTFTYYNEKGIDANGNLIAGRGVKFDANTLRIKEREGSAGKGIYDFYDGMTTLQNPLMTLSTRANSIVFENNSTTIEGDNIQEVIESIIQKIEVAQGRPASLKGEGILMNNQVEVAEAVLKEILLTIADQAISESKIQDGAVTSYKLRNQAVTSEKIAPGTDKYLLVTKNNTVQWVPATDTIIKEVVEQNEVVTLIENNGNGTYSYYNEKSIDANGNPIKVKEVLIDANTLAITQEADGTYVFKDGTFADTGLPLAVIDIAGTVIENITEILNDTTVQNDIYTTVAAQGKAATAADGSIQIDNGAQSVLSEMQISVANQGITPAKIQPGQNKQLLVTDANGIVNWVDVTDELIQELVDQNETVTLLVDGGDGTFTYYNEKGIDANGNLISGQGVKFDANTLRIKEREGSAGKGIYDFYDGMTTLQNPLMTLSTRANSIVFENNSTTIEGDNIQEVIESIIQKIEVAQGRPASLKGEGILMNNQVEVAEAVLKEILLTIADQAISESKIQDGAVTSYKLRNQAVTPEKIAPGTDKYLLVTKNNTVQWVPATDTIIKEVVEQNEVVTLIENNGNGTYSYYNEKSIDANGNPIKVKEVLIDANTLAITQEADGTYVFKDGTFADTGLPLAVIDIAGTVIENITEILNDTTVQNDIYTTVAAQGKATTAADGSIQIDNGGQSVLSEMQISVANQGITPAKIQPGTNKQLLLTDANGAVIWADASDTIIKEIVAQNEVVTLLVDGGDGTFTYYNEKGIDADGNLISGQGVKFDANTLRIEKNAANSYEFYDKTSTTTPIAVIDVAGSVIENITEILNDTTVQNTIYTTVAAQGKATTAADGSIQIDNGDQSVLSEMQISVANQGITTTKIKPGANKQLLVTDANGQVAWVDASDTIIKEIIEGNDVVTLLVDGGDGTFTYYNENGIDADGNLIAGQGIKFDANTLRIEKNAANKYEFYDKTSDTTPIAVIDVAGSVIENITEILNTEEVKNEIFTTVAANGKKMASNDGSIAITGGDKAVLNGVIVNIQQAGVKTDHIKDGAVTTQKITSAGSVKGAILTADGLGNTGFSAPSETVKPAMQGDLEGEAGVINIVGGGENVLFGDANKKVSIEINQGGITGTHIGFETIENNNIAKQTIGVTKLDATGETAGNVATVKADGTVSYQPLTSAIITDKGDITTDGIVSVDNGTGKVLGNVTLGINNQSVTASKLDATGAVTGAVATANADGTVTYKPLEAESLAAKGTLATDGIVTVDNGTDKVLADVTLGIKDKGITATQIADNTITNEQIALNTITVDRLSAGNEPPKRVMVIDENGIVKWGELDDLVTDAAGNLTTDSIIEITTGDGVNSLFNDVGLGIKDASITNQKIADKTVEIGKLSNAGSQPGMVMVTNTTGGFTYVDRETIVQAGEDLTLGNELEFLAGNGVSTLLAEAKIGIKEGGISTDKIGNQAVTPAKISSVGADENTVLTADGAGNVTYKKINEAAFEGTEADLKSDGSLLVPLANKAVLKETVIGIANSGVQTAHISNKAVTAAKIDAQTAVNGAVLTADGSGNAVFQSLDQVAQAQGKVLSSTDSSLAITANNKAVLQDVTIDVASSGIKSTHIAAMAVTEDKIGTNKGAGLVLTSNGAGGAEFKTLGQVIGTNGKAIEGSAAIAVEGGEHAALADVTIDVVDAGITAAKLAANSVTTAKIEDQAVTVNKITGDGGTLQLLGTNRGGEVKWLNADSDILKVIINSHETSTVLHDNGDGTFTYYNESQIDSEGNVIPGATGVKFNANTLKITQNPTGVFTFLDKSGTTPLAKIDTRAKSITFEDHSSIEYNNVEEAIFALNQKIEHLEELDIQKETLSGNGILVNGNANATEAVFKAIELSIADEAVTPTKIKGGIAKQILVTNALGKAQWVDATDDIIEEIVNTQERLTILQDNQDGTLTYFNEEDVDKNGTIIGSGVSFNANTLRIDSTEPAKYVFYDKLTNNPLATIDVQADVIEKITEILSDTTVQEHIYTTIVAQGKAVATDNSIAVSGGEKAVLQEMTISLRDGGVTAAKLFAGANKENFVPVAQADGTVEYQSMATVLQGHELAVDNSLEITGTGDASKALLQAVGLQVKEEGIANSHIQNLAVTAAKIGSELAEKGEVLTADGSGNAVFITSDEVIAPTMQGDLVGTEGIIVQGGENVLFGDEETSVVVKINDGGVKGKHIAASTITNTNIADHTIQAPKLTAGQGLENRVGVANAAGEITYQMLTSDIIIEKGNISTDGIITVSNNGVEKVLSDVTLGIANKSIGAGKLTGGNAPAGAVATVGSNGVSVTYKPITAASISNKGTLTTDGIITVDNGVDKVLENFRLGINDKGITTAKLADGAVLNTQLGEKAVTANKISAEGITAASVLLSRGDGEVVWGELGDIVTDTAGNLATDGIIQMTNGTGENTLLKDVTLSIAPNSITKDKLSSANGATNMPLDYILVTNGQGGFDYVLKEAVQAGGVDLELGSALVFTEGTDGLNAVLAPTSIDVKVGGIGTTKLTDGAVTIAKISSSGADENTVLTADGLGNVTYKKINEAAFEGTEADLKSDGSLLIPIGNKAVLAETVIGIADAGVDTKHLKSNAVTNDKISSTVAGTAAANGTILTADGNGNTAFQSFETVAATQGKAVTSTDASLAVTANNKAALQDLNITVAQEGIKTTHLATRNVTADKIGSVDKESGLVLTTDGQGGAEFRSIGDALVGSGKALQGGTGITIGGTGAAQALLKDATVSISNGGVGETQLASNAVTAIKVATAAITEAKLASNAVTTAKIANTAVTADKLAVNAVVTTKINAEAVTDEKLATNAVTTVKIATNAVTEAKLATDAVTSAKIKDGAITNTKIANNAVGQNHIYVQNILEKHFGNSAVSERAIASNAVTTAKVADKAITKAKISAAGETVGHVLTVESNGNVAFKAPTGQSTTANLLGTSTIKVTGGTNAILSQATLEVNGNSIKTEHIVDRAITADELDNNAVETSKIANKAVTNEKLADDAVGTNQLQIESVWGNVIKEQGIESDRLSSVENSSNAPEGHVLTADGNGGVSFQPASGGSTSGGSGFFYAPSFTVEIVPGATASKNVYDIYKNQFNGAIKSRSSASIHTYEANQLDYFVVYYDEDVFEDIAISEQGILTYKTKRNIEITSKTYFNVVMQQKVD